MGQRTELEDGEHMEQDEEQHGEQGKAEDIGRWLERNHLDQEEAEAFTDLVEEGCPILSALASSLQESELFSLIKWILMFGGRIL